MPKFSPTGHISAGVGGEGVSVDKVTVDLGGGACWLNDETILYQCNDGLGTSDEHWFLRTYNRVTKERKDFDSHSATYIIAGNNRWAATLANDYGTYGMLGHLPLAVVKAAGFDGTLVICEQFAIGKGLTIYAPDGTITRGNSNIIYNDVQVIAPDDVIYTTVDYQITTLKGRQFKIAGPAMNPNLIVVNGEEWLCYWTERLGIIAHPALALNDSQPLVGYILSPTNILAYNYDVRSENDSIRMISSTTQGERPQDIVDKFYSLDAPRYPLDDLTMRDCEGDLLLIKQDGARVDVEYKLRPESGVLSAIRYLDNGDISQPVDKQDALIHTYDLTVGVHSLSVRGVGKNGNPISVNSFNVTVEPVIIIPPIIEPLPFLCGTNFMPQPESLEAFRVNQFNAVRIKVGEWTPEQVPSWLIPIWIFNNEIELGMVPRGTSERPTLAQFRNEPNNGDGPAGIPAISSIEYARLVLNLAALARKRNIRVYWIGASNTGSKEQQYISEVISRAGEYIEYVAIHRYPQDGEKAQDWSKPRNNFVSLEAEFQALRIILKGRRWLITEFGIKETSWTQGVCKKVTMRVDQAEQARLLRGYARWIRNQKDSDGGFVYQSWEAATGAKFGLTTVNNIPKPAISCWI